MSERIRAGVLRELGIRRVGGAERKGRSRTARKASGDPTAVHRRRIARRNERSAAAEAARQRGHRLKVLFTTGYARNAIVHDGRVDPGVQLITKPFTYAALAGKLRDILDARTAPARILVVEDEMLIQMLAIESLEGLGFKVETAGTAADAKSKLRLLNGEVDAAIIDIGLPDAKGDVLLSELRAIYPLLPVLIASGHDEALLRKRFAGQKFIGFLSKPYTVDQLSCALRSIGALS